MPTDNPVMLAGALIMLSLVVRAIFKLTFGHWGRY